MKKRILSMLLCCLMLFGLVFTVSADPDQPEVDPVAHAITVTTENGTASASAEAAVKDTEITLTAVPKEGFRFKEWQVIKGGIEITDNKFVMPDEDVEVKAIFEAIPEVIPEEHDNPRWQRQDLFRSQDRCCGHGDNPSCRARQRLDLLRLGRGR